MGAPDPEPTPSCKGQDSRRGAADWRVHPAELHSQQNPLRGVALTQKHKIKNHSSHSHAPLSAPPNSPPTHRLLHGNTQCHNDEVTLSQTNERHYLIVTTPKISLYWGFRFILPSHRKKNAITSNRLTLALLLKHTKETSGGILSTNTALFSTGLVLQFFRLCLVDCFCCPVIGNEFFPENFALIHFPVKFKYIFKS